MIKAPISAAIIATALLNMLSAEAQPTANSVFQYINRGDQQTRRQGARTEPSAAAIKTPQHLPPSRVNNGNQPIQPSMYVAGYGFYNGAQANLDAAYDSQFEAQKNLKDAEAILNSTIPQAKAYGESESDFQRRVSAARQQANATLASYQSELDRQADNVRNAELMYSVSGGPPRILNGAIIVPTWRR